MTEPRDPPRWLEAGNECDPVLRRLLENAKHGLGESSRADALAERIERAVRDSAAESGSARNAWRAHPVRWYAGIGLAVVGLGVTATWWPTDDATHALRSRSDERAAAAASDTDAPLSAARATKALGCAATVAPTPALAPTVAPAPSHAPAAAPMGAPALSSSARESVAGPTAPEPSAPDARSEPDRSDWREAPHTRATAHAQARPARGAPEARSELDRSDRRVALDARATAAARARPAARGMPGASTVDTARAPEATTPPGAFDTTTSGHDSADEP
ncbi:MAG: hypothetical protein ABW321_10730, partial [Polyangiales bacterium]